MTLSAITLALFGFLSSFFSKELLVHLKISSNGAADMLIQIMAALYMGFAIMNWMQRQAIIGGIYSRPLAMGNFSHFLIGTFAFGRVLSEKPNLPGMWVLTSIYFLFALSFGIVMFFHPAKKSE